MSESRESAPGHPDAVEIPVVARRRTRVPRKLPFDAIKDDARRSISVRVNTSDYGRLKAAARRLGVRESDVFRHLLRIGLARLLRVLAMDVSPEERYRLLICVAAEFGEDFGMTARDCVSVLDAHGSLALDDGDLELIGLAATHPLQASVLLDRLAGTTSDPANLNQRLGTYLAAKHCANIPQS